MSSAMTCAEVPSTAVVRGVGIDWGTTHRRGYAIDGDGHCLAEVADTQGMLAARGHFEAALDEMLAALGVRDPMIPVVMSGMVGSAQGWVDAGYLDAPLPLTSLPQHLTRAPGRRGRTAIVPGVVLRNGAGIDVMRGEETQLLGAVALGHADGWFVLPGTHCKWVRLEGGAIVDFATYLTGELFDLLTAQGTLAAAIDADGEWQHDEAAFADGLAAAATGRALSQALFGLRARIVTGALPARYGRAYLSGLLIGAEWHDMRRSCAGRWPERVRIVASANLVARHADAARMFGVDLQIVDARAAYLAALTRLID